MNYLSIEEQFKESLNNEEISRIEDDVLRAIREKYWNLRRNAFIDESHIADSEIGQVWNELKSKEMEEIKWYRIKNNI